MSKRSTAAAVELFPDDSGTGEEAVEVAAETLTGDIRDFILDRLRHEQSKRPWHERSEADQRDTIAQVEAACSRVVRPAIEAIAAQGRRAIRAHLESVTIKDGVKAVISLSKADEQRHALYDAQGFNVLIVVADADEFTGEREPADVRPDWPDLPAAVPAAAQVGALAATGEEVF